MHLKKNMHGLWNNSTSANAKENEIEINITNASGKANSMECESIFGLCFSHTTTKLQLDELKDLRVVCLLCTTNDILASMTYPFWHTKRRFTSPTHEHVKLLETDGMNAQKSEQEKPITINTHRTHGATLPHTHSYTFSLRIHKHTNANNVRVIFVV